MKKRSRVMPRSPSLVRLRDKKRAALPFRAGRVYVFLGELRNMPGHCVVADQRSGMVYAGYHTENFEEVPPDEV